MVTIDAMPCLLMMFAACSAASADRLLNKGFKSVRFFQLEGAKSFGCEDTPPASALTCGLDHQRLQRHIQECSPLRVVRLVAVAAIVSTSNSSLICLRGDISHIAAVADLGTPACKCMRRC